MLFVFFVWVIRGRLRLDLKPGRNKKEGTLEGKVFVLLDYHMRWQCNVQPLRTEICDKFCRVPVVMSQQLGMYSKTLLNLNETENTLTRGRYVSICSRDFGPMGL